MSNGDDAIQTLIAECGAAVEDIKDAQPARSCEAHEPLSRGVIALLRCQVAYLERLESEAAESRARCRRLREWLARNAVSVLAVAAALSIGILLGGESIVREIVQWLAL